MISPTLTAPLLPTEAALDAAEERIGQILGTHGIVPTRAYCDAHTRDIANVSLAMAQGALVIAGPSLEGNVIFFHRDQSGPQFLALFGLL